MKKCLLVLLVLFTFIAPQACTDGKEPDDPQKVDCKASDCQKKACPQTDSKEYDACVEKLDQAFTYHICNNDEKSTCTVTDPSTMLEGEIVVKLENSGFKIPNFFPYVFPTRDADGKAITCERLKNEADLGATSLNRLYPPRTHKTIYATPNGTDGSSDTVPLLYVNHKDNSKGAVPQGKHIVVVTASCHNSDGSVPTSKDKPGWWACKENVEFKDSGNTSTPGAKIAADVTVTITLKQGDFCP